MATQGICSITSGGKTFIKFITGSNGMHVGELSEFMAKLLPTKEKLEEFLAQDDLEDSLLELAHNAQLSKLSTIILYRKNDLVNFIFGEIDPNELGDRTKHIETMDNPVWNPRWDHGTACHMVEVRMSVYGEKPLISNY